MRKIIFLTVAILLVISGSQNSHARTYYRTFEVAEITSEGIILKDFEGGRFLVNKDPSG